MSILKRMRAKAGFKRLRQNGCHDRRDRPAVAAFVLVELALAVLIIALVVGLLCLNIEGILHTSRMDRDVSRFVNTLRLTVEQAIFTRSNYIVDINVMDGYYVVYPEPTDKDADFDEVEAYIPERQLLWSYLYDVAFGDGRRQYSGNLKLKATPKGWERTVLMTLHDQFDQLRYVRCDRVTAQVHKSRFPLEIPPVRKRLTLRDAL